MEKINAIIIDGKAYVVVPRGSRHCNDCALFNNCRCGVGLCLRVAEAHAPVIFRYSPELTERINNTKTKE